MTADIVQATVAKDLSIIVKGYTSSLARLRTAVTSTDADEVYIALGDLIEWLSRLENDPRVSSDADVQAVGFARDRAHHQWASVVSTDAQGVSTWRPASLLPAPDNPRLASAKKQPTYESRLEAKPILEVFDPSSR